VGIPERKNNEFLRADRFGKRIFTELDVDTLSQKLNEIGAKYENYEVTVDDNIYPVIKSNIEQMYKFIESAHERVREIMATFVPRYNNLLYIFSLHHMCAEMKDKLDVEDVKYGATLTNFLFKEVMTWVEESISLIRLNSKEQSYLNSAFLIYRSMKQNEDGYVMKVSFIKQCSAKWRISMHTVIRYLEKFKGFNKLKEVELSKVKYIKIEI
jgi:hypothetical protein